MFLSSKMNMEAIAYTPLAGAISGNDPRYFRPLKEDSKFRGFDMNCLPQDGDKEEDEEEETNPASSSSPSSFTAFSCPWLQTRPLPLKRDRGGEPCNSVVEQSSPRGSDEEEAGTRKKLRLSKDQSALLEDSFREHSTLTTSQKLALSKKLDLKPRQVEVWFQNRRARTKLKQTEVECEVLRRCCESLTEENRRLQKELQELRALKISPPCVYTQDNFMPLPAATLTMCPSCEKIASSDTNRSHHLAAVACPPKPSSPAHRRLSLYLQPLGQTSAA